MHITGNMVFAEQEREAYMEEKTYKVIGSTGILNIVLGIISITVGVAAGVLLLVSGAKLLAGKARILI